MCYFLAQVGVSEMDRIYLKIKVTLFSHVFDSKLNMATSNNLRRWEDTPSEKYISLGRADKMTGRLCSLNVLLRTGHFSSGRTGKRIALTWKTNILVLCHGVIKKSETSLLNPAG